MTSAPKTVVLTPPKRAVLILVVRGMTNKEIAARLDRSEQTVKKHISSLTRCFGVRSRSELVRAVLLGRTHALRQQVQDQRQVLEEALVYARRTDPGHPIVGWIEAVLPTKEGAS